MHRWPYDLDEEVLTGSRISGRTIEVLVGDKDELFSVHQSLIRASSSFFEKALGGKWKESAQRTVRLPDDDPNIFALYIHWIYFGAIPVSSIKRKKAVENSEITDLVKAYIMGDKLLDPAFQDATIDAIIEETTGIAERGNYYKQLQNAVSYAYCNSCEPSPIREVLVDIFAHDGQDEWLSGWTPPLPFFSHLTSALLNVRKAPKTSLDNEKYRTPKGK